MFLEENKAKFGLENYPDFVDNIAVANASSSTPSIGADIFTPNEGIFDFIGNTTFYDHVHKSYSDLSDSWGNGPQDVHFLHYGYSGSLGDYNTFHYEKRSIFHTIGDVESMSGSTMNSTCSITDYTGTITNGVLTGSKDFKNQSFIRINGIVSLDTGVTAKISQVFPNK